MGQDAPLPPLLVREHGKREADALELDRERLAFRGCLGRVLVWMAAQSRLAISLGDLVTRGGAHNPQDRVEDVGILGLGLGEEREDRVGVFRHVEWSWTNKQSEEGDCWVD